MSIRRRLNASTGEDAELDAALSPANDGVVLDEQEQERIISKLRLANKISNAENARTLQAIVGLSIAFQLYFLFGTLSDPTNTWTPLSSILYAYFPTKYNDPSHAKLIPLRFLFPLLSIVHHALDIAHLHPYTYTAATPQAHSWDRTLHLLVPYSWTRVLPLFAPLLSAALKKDGAQIIWWSLPAFISGTSGIVDGWMQSGISDLDQLEKLQYPARGA